MSDYFGAHIKLHPIYGSRKQRTEVGRQALKRGIDPYEEFRFVRFNKVQSRWRNAITGRLVKHK